jgi:pantothenate kinase
MSESALAVPGLHADLLRRLHALSAGPRRLLGLVAPPGAGKSTLAALLVRALGERAQAVPLDGFHLAQTELLRLGRTQRKGAPDTFDAAGYAALLQRLRHQGKDQVVYAPDFRREIEEPVAGALPVFPHTPLVITEGNYLLLDETPWQAVAAALDEVWYLQVDTSIRLERLATRHVQFGRSREAALDWIAQSDEPNARRVEACAHRAHRRVTCDETSQTYHFLA